MSDQEQFKLLPDSRLKRGFEAVTFRPNFRFAMSVNNLVVAAQDGDNSAIEKILNKHQKYLTQNPQAIDALESWKIDTGKTVFANALMKALAGKHVDTVELLLNRGASAILGGSWKGDNFTVLHFAAIFGNKDMMAMLLKRDDILAIIDARTKEGSTALSQAIAAERKTDIATVELLLKAGASPYINNNANESPTDIARHFAWTAGYNDAAALLEQWIQGHPASEYQSAASSTKRNPPKAQP